jgi:hypothetical protein
MRDQWAARFRLRRNKTRTLIMKKLTLTFATALLATVSGANAENSTIAMDAQPDAAPNAVAVEKPQAPDEGLTYAAFRMIQRQIDVNYQRLTSIKPAAMQCHMSCLNVTRTWMPSITSRVCSGLPRRLRIRKAVKLPRVRE